MSEILQALGIGTIGIVGIIILIALFFVIGTAFTAFFVALIWNWIGLHALFGAAALSFWQVVGVAAALNLIGGIFRGGAQVNAS
jgi:hypothetical protein